MRSSTRAGLIALACLVIALPACSVLDWGGDPPPPPKRTTNGEKSARGNPPFYEVFGERYYVLDSSYGYNEKGVASWYGKKFHGKPTSSGEIYDMHMMTAAHKTLPLPTDVRVTNLQNGRSVIVRVNDRGPFIDNRIIDMSYAAAHRLDMTTNGTALVRVEALSGPGIPTAGQPTLAGGIHPAGSSGSPSVSPIASAVAEPIDPEAIPAADAIADRESINVYLQIGAFGERLNARQLQQQLQARGISNVVVHFDGGTEPALYRVRLGPIKGVNEYDALLKKMAAMQIIDTHLVTEFPADQAPDLSATDVGNFPGG